MRPIDFEVKRSKVKVNGAWLFENGFRTITDSVINLWSWNFSTLTPHEFVGVGGGPVLLQQYFQYAFICCPYMLPLLLYSTSYFPIDHIEIFSYIFFLFFQYKQFATLSNSERTGNPATPNSLNDDVEDVLVNFEKLEKEANEVSRVAIKYITLYNRIKQSTRIRQTRDGQREGLPSFYLWNAVLTYSIIWRYLQLLKEIFKYLKIFLIHLKISSNNWSYIQLFEDIFKYWICIKTLLHIKQSQFLVTSLAVHHGFDVSL